MGTNQRFQLSQKEIYMSRDKAYRCEICKGEALAPTDGPAPECCGKKMQNIPLDQCTLSTTAEHARFDQDDGPCDDGRSG
jgi:hypothetical protein